jgi:DNA-binding MarR family transcriptional regulator
MNDKNPKPVGQNNIRGLVQDLSERLDAKSNDLRSATPFASTRPADAKTFMLISRNPRGLTALSKALKISRQAAHMSVMRLVDAGMVSFEFAEGSKRDMVANLTEEGLKGRQVGLKIAATIEGAIREKVGDQDLETLRRILMKLNE